MTPTTFLSSDSQREIIAQADTAQHRANGKARKCLRWSLGLLGAGLLVGAVFPPAVLPGLASFIAITSGVVVGAYGAGNKMNARMLAGVKAEAATEGFAAKMNTRAQRFGRAFQRMDKLSDRGLYAALGIATAAFLLPALSGVAWIIYSGVVTVMGAATIARAVVRDASKTSGEINALTQQLAVRNSVPPPNDNTPPAPGLTPDFAKAVNGPQPAAEKAPVQAPVPPKP